MDTSTTLKEGYEILDIIDKAPYGYNFRAKDLKTNRTVLLKIFTRRSQTTPQDFQTAKEAIKREAALLHSLDHPQIATYHRYFKLTDSSDSLPREYRVLVQTWIEGQSYGHHLRRSPFSETQTIQFLQSLLPVLTHLHTQTPQLIHGNLNPDHILQSPDGTPILINFGGPQRAIAATATSPILKPIGSHPIFSPPEQRKGKPLTPSSDLYSLAVTALCLLTGQPNPTCLYDKVNQRWQWQQYLPTEITRLNPAFIAILDRMLDPDSDRCYTSAESVYLALLNLSTNPNPIDNVDYFVDTPISNVDHIINPTQPKQAKTVARPPATNPKPQSASPKSTQPKTASSINSKISDTQVAEIPPPDQYLWTGPMAPIGKARPALDFTVRKILVPGVLALSAFGLLKGGYDHLTQRPDPTAKDCIKGVAERRPLVGFQDSEVDKYFHTAVPSAPAFLDPKNPNHDYYVQQWCFAAHAVMDAKVTGSTPSNTP